MSLRARLVLLVLALTTTLLGGLALGLGLSLRGWADESVDAELTRRAEVLVAEAHFDDGALELDDDDDLATRGLPFRIETQDGRLLRGTERWPVASRSGLGFVTIESRAADPVRVLSVAFTPPRASSALVLRVAAPLTAYTRLTKRFREGLLFALGLAALLSAGGATLLARRFLAPLLELSAEVDALEAGKLEGRLDTRGLDVELARFAFAFNGLLDRIAAVLLGQRHFVGRASHALRTPLASILTQAEVALRRDRSEPEYRYALESIAAAARDAARLSDGLLALTRADEAPHTIAQEDVDLAALGAEVERLFRPRTEAAGLTLVVSVPPGLTARVSRGPLREVLDALLDNALRYTPKGGTVRLSARTAGPRVALEVSDTGPGIALDERAHVFERFYRGRAAEASSASGSGLGLAVVKALVSAEGGTLTLDEAPGGGARFGVTFAVPTDARSVQ